MTALLLFATKLSDYWLAVVGDERCPEDWVKLDHSLRELVDNDALRFVFVGGKGGVGKTTTSSALAIQLARARHAQGMSGILLLSTDPAHSLGDAFGMNFSGEPQPIEGVEGLHVMEIDPEVGLRAELRSWETILERAGGSSVTNLGRELKHLQNWLVSFPGIDEATALASVVKKVESGNYSTIVFDTAPTGHTLKLLSLPDLLEAGLSKLESWQGKLWGYYQMFSMFNMEEEESDTEYLKEKLAEKLRDYKNGVAQVGTMMKNTARTSFITVCIAEHLSIEESRRLLEELRGYGIHTNHIVVNQLVQGAPTPTELAPLKDGRDGAEALARIVEVAGLDASAAERLMASAELCQAREAIQTSYLAKLEGSREAACIDVVKVPLLPSEVTGPAALARFSEFLVGGASPTRHI